MIIRLQDLRRASDNEVLACYEEMRRENVKTNDFQNTYGTDYSYSSLTNELQMRGYVNGWYKPSEETDAHQIKEIKVGFSKDNARMNLNVTRECKERYEKFLKDKSYSFVHNTAAIMNYLDEIESKSIKVSVEVI